MINNGLPSVCRPPPATAKATKATKDMGKCRNDRREQHKRRTLFPGLWSAQNGPPLPCFVLSFSPSFLLMQIPGGQSICLFYFFFTSFLVHILFKSICTPSGPSALARPFALGPLPLVRFALPSFNVFNSHHATTKSTKHMRLHRLVLLLGCWLSPDRTSGVLITSSTIFWGDRCF